MFRVQVVQKYIIFCSVLIHLSCGSDLPSARFPSFDSLGKTNFNNQPAEDIAYKNAYPRTNSFSNRDIYDYSYEYDSFLNRIKNDPPTVVSYHPFSLQNIEYSYPRIYNRPYPYTSNIISKNYSPLSPNIPAYQEQIPTYRDAEKVEPATEVQVIKRLVPIGYSTEIVSPRENYVSEALMDTARPLIIHQLVSPQMGFVPLRSNIIANLLAGYDTNTLMKALSFVEKTNSTAMGPEDMDAYKQKMELIIRLLHAAPKFATEFFQCLAESKSLKEIIQDSTQQKVTKEDLAGGAGKNS